MLTICPLYEVSPHPWGGVNTFFRNMTRSLDAAKHVRLEADPCIADIILCAGNYLGPGKILKTHTIRNLASGRGPKHLAGWIMPSNRRKGLVFRVDGLRKYYAGLESHADATMRRNISHAGAVVYQSEYSQHCFHREKFPLPNSSTVSLNGADLSIFAPCSYHLDSYAKLRLISNSWSTNSRKGFALIARFSNQSNVDVSHVGRWPSDIPHGDVHLLGELHEYDIAASLRTHHFFLFPSEHEACSNAVVEALASGLPVLYHSSGGTIEQCQGETFGVPFTEKMLLGGELTKFLECARARLPELRVNVKDSRNLFGFGRCFSEYVSFFTRIMDESKPNKQ